MNQIPNNKILIKINQFKKIKLNLKNQENFHYYFANLILLNWKTFVSINNRLKIFNHILTLKAIENNNELTCILKTIDSNLIKKFKIKDNVSVCGKIERSQENKNQNYLILNNLDNKYHDCSNCFIKLAKQQ